MKTALVTGAAGFCGSHLSCELLDQGFHVIGTYIGSVKPSVKNVEWRQVDIRDADQVSGLVKAIQPDYFFHLAAQTIPRLSWEKITETFEVNIDGTRNLFSSIAKFSPECRSLFISTNQVYGKLYNRKASAQESDLPEPSNPYAVSKVMGEMIVRHLVQQYGLTAVIARPHNHFGPGQLDQFVFSDWCKQIALIEKGEAKGVLRVGNLDVRRDTLHVSDVVKAYLLLILYGEKGEIYNVCREEADLLRDCLEFLIAASKSKIDFEVDSSKIRDFDPPKITGSAERLRALNWRPSISTQDALISCLEDWRSRV